MAQLEYTKLKSMVDHAIDSMSDARLLSERDRNYYDGYQWSADEIATLNARKQPIITNNRIKAKVDGMVGIEQRSRVDPKALARNPQDEQAADVITKALIYVDDKTNFDSLKSSAFENLLVEGYGGAEVIVQPMNGQMEVVVQKIRWEEIVFDPSSREKNFSDASFLGYQKWMPVDEAVTLYGSYYEGEDTLENVLNASMNDNNAVGTSYEDRPFNNSRSKTTWVDSKSKRVRVATIYYKRAGIWYLSIFCSSAEIYNKPSPYLDEYDNPTCALHLMSAYIDSENRRYGLTRSMISLQDEVNARYSKLLHYFNSRQTMGIKGAVDVADMKRELAKPDGHIEVDLDSVVGSAEAGMKTFELIQNGDQSQGQLVLLQASLQALDNVGPNLSLFGQGGDNQSGRAIMAQQQAALATVSPIFDSLREWNLMIYRSMWLRIRQYWTDERWLRITDDANVAQFIQINKIVGQQQQIDPETGEIVMTPILENELALMDVDINIEDVPDFVTLRAEQFEQLANMASRGIQIPIEMIIESSSIHNKDKLMKMVAEQKQMQQMQMQMEQQQMQIQAEAAMREKQQQYDLEMKRLELEMLKLKAQTETNAVKSTQIVAETNKTIADTTMVEVQTAKLLS